MRFDAGWANIGHDDVTLMRQFGSSMRHVAPTTLLIGPEAGFTAEEHAQARAAGVPIATLGPTVLRTETAAIVAAARAAATLRA